MSELYIINNTSALTPDGGLINGFGAVSHGNISITFDINNVQTENEDTMYPLSVQISQVYTSLQ